MGFDDSTIKEYEAGIPEAEDLDKLISKGKLEPMIISSRLKLSKIEAKNYEAWIKDPAIKFIHDPMIYEELVKVGYQPGTRELVGVINIKQPYGYGGSCPLFKGLGSMEYVRFYVDWRGDNDFDDIFEDQGTAAVHVFDPEQKNEKKLPLEYAVIKKIEFPDKLFGILKSCRIVRVRAILSWNTPPPPKMPNFRPYWGNRFETNIRFHM